MAGDRRALQYGSRSPSSKWCRRSRVAALFIGSILISLVLAEGILRLLDYRFSPIVFVWPDNENDWRPHHMQGDGRPGSGDGPLTLFDPVLLWKLNPGGSRFVNDQGCRGPVVRPDRNGNEYLIIAIGDSNTIGPLDRAESWPGSLQDMAALNHSARPILVVNAGVFGYSSFQGLRRFQQVLPWRPDLVFFSFGANDAHPVRVSDEEYARRIERLGRWSRLRLALPAAHLAWSILDRIRPESGIIHRVSIEDYRRNLSVFVQTARERGIIPVLLTRPHIGTSDDPHSWAMYVEQYNDETRQTARDLDVDCLDIETDFREKADCFADNSHFSRRGCHLMAQIVLAYLESRGVVDTDYAYHPSIDLAAAPDEQPELDEGWWSSEPWGDGLPAGRWTQGEASLVLQRRDDEKSLFIDMDLHNPFNLTTGEIVVNGVPVAILEAHNGRLAQRLEISQIPGSILHIRFAITSAFVPSEDDAPSEDDRELGVFVRRVELTSLDSSSAK
ncbi:MAG: SGNH/GDSL hydrolase family protein [Acidobacteriota bacterium]